MVVLGERRAPRSVRFAEGKEQLCVFELIYFARPDSYMLGRNLYEARRRMGEQLALEAPADADLVMPVPGHRRAGRGRLCRAERHPVSRGHGPQPIRRPDVHPAVERPAPARRARSSCRALREQVRGRRLVVVDDSIVRGTTTRQIVGLLRKAGAREVHLRISAPPIFNPCFYGIDTQIETELIAATKSVDEIRDFVGADSLSYLSIGGVLQGLDLPRERFCFACFDGNYPVPVPYDVANHKFLLEQEPLVVAG